MQILELSKGSQIPAGPKHIAYIQYIHIVIHRCFFFYAVSNQPIMVHFMFFQLLDTSGELIAMEMRIQHGDVGLLASYWDGGDPGTPMEKKVWKTTFHLFCWAQKSK